MVRLGLRLETQETRVRSLPWPSSAATPKLPDATNLCYQEALDWRKWANVEEDHLLSFVRPLLISKVGAAYFCTICI